MAQSNEVAENTNARASKAKVENMVKEVSQGTSAELKAYVAKNFSASEVKNQSAKYKKFLKKTVKSNANYDVKKMALYMLYGEEGMEQHMEEIKQTTRE